MSKTVEELLKPRYRVVADYFFSPFQIGDIITVSEDRSLHLTTTCYRNEFGETVEQAHHYTTPTIDKYPHLFKKLEWWEDRDIEDLPMYLKDQGRIWKLKRWDKDFIGRPTPVNIIDGEGDTEMSSNIAWYFRKNKMLPATAEEYNNYKAKKDGQ